MLPVNGFYGHVRSNNLRSMAMFAGFALAFQVMAAALLFFPLIVLDAKHSALHPPAYLERYVPVVFFVSVAVFVLRFMRHVASVRATIAFTDVSRRTEPRLVNIVETLAITAGLPAPRVGVLESPALNAFACGLTPASAIVVVTRGLLDTLEDAELAAVVAHEVAHIRHGDIRVMAAANVLMENLHWLSRRNILAVTGWKAVVLLVVMPAFLIMGAVTKLGTGFATTLGRVVRLLISSSREFMADAEAVRMTHDPEALMSALLRIEGRSQVWGLPPQADAMMIDGFVEGPLASHPTIPERIAVLARHAHVAVPISAASDTPRLGSAVPGNVAFAYRAALAQSRVAPAAGPPRSLFKRVGVGVGAEPTTRGAWTRTMFAAFVVAGLLVNLIPIISSGLFTRAIPLGSTFAAVSSSLEPRSATASHRQAGKPAVAQPREVRCFATVRYQVGDRGMYQVGSPDEALVRAYADGRRSDSSEIRLERYLGMRLRALDRIAAAAPAEIDRALADYVETRKIVLQVVHRFFGDPGLDLMRGVYEGPADATVLSRLRERRAAGTLAPQLDADPNGDLDLLLAAPRDFIPCAARSTRKRSFDEVARELGLKSTPK